MKTVLVRDVWETDRPQKGSERLFSLMKRKPRRQEINLSSEEIRAQNHKLYEALSEDDRRQGKALLERKLAYVKFANRESENQESKDASDSIDCKRSLWNFNHGGLNSLSTTYTLL